MEEDSRREIREALTAVKAACRGRESLLAMLEALRPPGPVDYYSERVLIGALLGGETTPGKLYPVRALDFASPLHRAIFWACDAVPGGDPNPRLANIIKLLEADGVLGLRDSIDDLLLAREEHRGERIGEHVRRVSEAGSARRMGEYLEELAQQLRAGGLSSRDAEDRLKKKLWPAEKPPLRTVSASISRPR